jgi:hypothetical protein
MSILFLLLFSPKNCEFEGTRPGVLDIRHRVNFISYTGYSCRKEGYTVLKKLPSVVVSRCSYITVTTQRHGTLV